MKLYAIDYDNKCVSMEFRSEQEADEAFNSAFLSENGVGDIVDSKGNIYKIFVSKGYSKNRTEILYYVESGVMA